ncbi:uncharacterized protein LOC106056716 [Biomphalaria glabrata]|uniref:Uncharacterized protein LOC106056716 n=1 Tax=Biomphalaria glabrata TaxID=6526 RepID=A0A9W2YBZ6_BIOGL|nr:uncharacterized protein LOC106056716 [Biomphalaria glabrata]XP_055860262.1 uncharacterized protein LOC106056716 [Biomphalaria glabrata]
MRHLNKLSEPLLLFILVSSLSTLSAEPICNEVCFKGKYCDLQTHTCITCPYGSFMALDAHTKTFCIKWTRMSGPHVTLVKAGSSERDAVWGCEEGFDQRIISAAGEWACMKASTTSTTTHSTTPKTTSTLPIATMRLETTVATGSIQESKTAYIVIGSTIGGVVFLSIIVGVVALTWYIRNRNDRSNNNLLQDSGKPMLTTKGSIAEYVIPNDLQNLFSKVVQVLGLNEFKTLIIYLPDPSKTFNTNCELNSIEDCDFILKAWAQSNPDIKHSLHLMNSLQQIGYILPKETNKLDINEVTECLSKAHTLNGAYIQFCYRLFTSLGPQHIDLLVSLCLKADYDNRMKGRNPESAFVDTLGKWAFQFPFVWNEQLEWEPLCTVKEELTSMGRKDIVDYFRERAANVYDVMSTFRKIQNDEVADVNLFDLVNSNHR